jgi:trypsin-like peptidase
MLKHILSLTALGCLLATGCHASDLEDVIERTLKKAVVKIDVSTNTPVFENGKNVCKSEGTGFLISAKLVVTAAHVYRLPTACGEPIVLVKSTGGGGPVLASVVDDKDDISILRVAEDLSPDTCALSFKSDVFGTQAIRYGIPGGFSEPPTAEHIRIGDQVNQFMPLVVMSGNPTEHGESGGPVINLFNVVGVIHGKHQDYANFSFMTVGSTVTALLTKNAITVSGHLCNPVEASTAFTAPYIFTQNSNAFPTVSFQPGKITASISVDSTFAQAYPDVTKKAFAGYEDQFRGQSFSVDHSSNAVKVARDFDPKDVQSFNGAADDVFRATARTKEALQQELWDAYIADGTKAGKWENANSSVIKFRTEDACTVVAGLRTCQQRLVPFIQKSEPGKKG